LEDAIAMLAKYGGEAKPIAGGQSLVPMMAFRLAAPQYLIDISRLPGLSEISIDDQGVQIGALVRWRDIERSTALARAHPLLVEAVRHVAHYQIRNRGTVGGSLAHADPAAEMPGIAMTCDAQIVVAGPRGQRLIAAKEFFSAALSTALAFDELIVAVQFPPWPVGRRWAFHEFARRRGDFALAGVAAFYDPDPDGAAFNVHIGVIGVADTPLRLTKAEAAVDGRPITEELVRSAAAIASSSVDPSDDIHAPGDYRRALLGVLVERALAQASGISMEGGS
jgi:carbon-monoxide dehydrogenase medium subunit